MRPWNGRTWKWRDKAAQEADQLKGQVCLEQGVWAQLQGAALLRHGDGQLHVLIDLYSRWPEVEMTSPQAGQAECGFKNNPCSPEHPEGNGIAERFMAKWKLVKERPSRLQPVPRKSQEEDSDSDDWLSGASKQTTGRSAGKPWGWGRRWGWSRGSTPPPLPAEPETKQRESRDAGWSVLAQGEGW